MASNNVIGNIILEGAVTAEDTVIVSGGSSKRVSAQGTLQDADVENRNRRIYGKADLFPEITGPRLTELVSTGNAKGEAGHPLSEDLVRQQTIDPKFVCVNYTKIWTEGNLVKAIYKGTNNALGQEFDEDLRSGEKPSFSLRALGGIEMINGKAHVKNIKIITWDRVYYPSHKRAYTEKLLSESAIIGGKTTILENQLVVPVDDPGRIITLRESDARVVLDRLQKESASVSMIVETFSNTYDKVTLLENGQLLLSNCMGGKIYVNADNHIDNVIKNFVFKF